MPPRKAVTAGKLRVQKEREERAKQEPAVEPEVELEEPEEEPAAVEFSPGKEKLITWLGPSAGEAYEAKARKGRADLALKLAKLHEEAAELQAQREADWAEELEKDRLELLERREVDRLREQQQVAACANGCVCVCAYGGSRKRDLSAMGSPLVSRSVSTFNANV